MQDVQLDLLAGFSHYYPGEEIYIGSLMAEPERSENLSMVFHNFSLADAVSADARITSASPELMLKFRYTVLEPGNPLLQLEHVTLYEQNCNDPSKGCRIKCAINDRRQIIDRVHFNNACSEMVLGFMNVY